MKARKIMILLAVWLLSMSIQQKMWNVVKGTKNDIYVSNPAHGGGMHNYGMAVDITPL